MYCAKCQFENPTDACFCNHCGTHLEAAQTVLNDLVLDENLAKLQRYLPQGLTHKIAHQRDETEGERKLVTVMFCDMAGFTPLVERIGAEKAYAVMGQIYEILICQVNDFQGTINEMTGDGVMALFGAPIALEEAPLRALWAALGIHRELASFSAQNEELDPVRMRIGVHCGPVVVGTLGNDLRVEFKAVGDTVNLASRMERIAQPGTTYVTHEVYRQAYGMFDFETLGKRFIGGMTESLLVYRLLPGERDVHRPRLGSERGIFSAMVGRAGALEALARQVTKLVRGEGSVVNVTGEAGIGKTRLVTELKQRPALRQVTVLEGRSISMGRNLSFHPIVDLFKACAGISGEDDEKLALAKLEAVLGRLLEDKMNDVLPFVATLLGMRLPKRYAERVRGIEGDALEKMIRRSVREIVELLSDRQPLIVIMEDLHWADISSLELLAYLYHLVKQARVLFINIFRPAYESNGLSLLPSLEGALAAYRVDIPLAPLDEDGSEALIANMLGLRGFHHAVVDQIVQRAGGNPYFIEEVVRSLIDEGAVVLRDGQFSVTDKLASMTIPNTINDVLMARIDRLDEEARDLLKTAAVIGRHFFYRILAEVAGSGCRVDDRLADLKTAQLIAEGERLDEREYQFKHALAQEAAYAAILPEKRRRLHLRVADAIETVFADKLNAFYGMLAYHYSRAESLERAEEALVKAGEEALKSSASSEALHYYMEALRLYQQESGAAADSDRLALLERNIALAFFNRGQYEEAVTYFDRVLGAYWKDLPAPGKVAASKLLSALGHLLVSLWQPWFKFRRLPSAQDHEAVDLYFKKLKALGIINPTRYFIESLLFYKRISRFELSHFDVGHGLFVGASSLFSFSGLSFRLSRKILDAVAEKIPRKDNRAYLLYDFVETLHHYLAGNWQAVKHFNEDLVKENLRIGEVYFVSLHLHWHGIHQLHRGDLSVAQWLVGQLDEIAEVYENDFSLLLKLLLNTGLLLECRRLDAARAETAAGIEFAKRSKSGLGLIHFYGCLAHLHLLADDHNAAEETLQRVDAIRRELQPVPWQVSAYLRSRAEFDLGRLQEAESQGRRAEMRRRRQQAYTSCRALVRQSRKVAQFRTDACRLMGVYCWLNRKPHSALRWWRKSIRDGQRLGARIQLARAHFDIGRHLSQPQGPCRDLDGIGASAYLAKAESVFEALLLEWDLERLRSINDGRP